MLSPSCGIKTLNLDKIWAARGSNLLVVVAIYYVWIKKVHSKISNSRYRTYQAYICFAWIFSCVGLFGISMFFTVVFNLSHWILITLTLCFCIISIVFLVILNLFQWLQYWYYSFLVFHLLPWCSILFLGVSSSSFKVFIR